jgi:hypothetical protein
VVVVVVPDAVGVGLGVAVGVGDGFGDADGVELGRCVGVRVGVCVVISDGLVVVVLTGALDVRVGVGVGRVVWWGAVGAGVEGPPVEGLRESLPFGRSAAIPAPTTTRRTRPNSAIIGRDTERRRCRGKPPVPAAPMIGSGAVGGRW